MMPKIKYRLSLTAEEREELDTIVRKGKHSSHKVLNALILLNCDEQAPTRRTLKEQQIADVLNVSVMTLYRVKQRFVEDGLEVALNGRKGQRAYEKKADGEFEAHLVALSCSSPPSGHERWSLRLLADKVVELQYIDSVSYETVRRVLKKTNSNLGKRPGG
jgi:transposase